MPGRRPDQASARGQTLRAKIVFYAFFVIALFIIAKFYIVQVRDGPSLADVIAKAFYLVEEHVTLEACHLGALANSFPRERGIWQWV